MALPGPSQVQREHHLPVGDFPDPARFKEILSAFDLSSFPKVTAAMVKQVCMAMGERVEGQVQWCAKTKTKANQTLTLSLTNWQLVDACCRGCVVGCCRWDSWVCRGGRGGPPPCRSWLLVL